MDALGSSNSFFQDSSTGQALLHSPLRRSVDALPLPGTPSGHDDRHADPALLKMMMKGKCMDGRGGPAAAVRDNIRAAWMDRSASAQQLQAVEGIWDAAQMGLDADDRERDVPLSGSPNPLAIHALSASPQLEAAIGSWPGAGNPTSLDAELPDFRGKPVRTGSNLASMAQTMSRTGSFSNGMSMGCGPSAAAVAAAAVAASGGLLSREGSFSADSFFNACNSAPITPRSPMTPLFDLAAGTGAAPSQLDAVASGFGKDGPASSLGQRGNYGALPTEPRQHKPSKLRISSSEYDIGNSSDYTVPPGGNSAVAAAVQQAVAALDGYHPPHGVGASTPVLGSGSGSPEPGTLPAAVAHEARLQMQQAAALHHQATMQQAALQQAVAATAALGGGQGSGFSAAQPFVPPQPHGSQPQTNAQTSAAGANMAAMAAAVAQQMPQHGMGPAPMMHQQMQQAFMMGMAAQQMQAGGQPPAGVGAGSWPPPFPVAPGAFPGWQQGGMPGFGMPGAPDGAGMPFGVPPYGFPPMTPECFAMWQGIWQQMQASCMGMNGPNINTMAIAAAAAAAAAAATASNPDEKDVPATRMRDGSGGSLDRMAGRVGDRTARSRDRVPATRGGRGDDIPRSTNPLLEEFKSSKSRKIEMKEVLGNMLDFSLDQHGSRFIQLKLDTLSPEDLATAFRELAPKAMVLMNDVFGNYVIQKVLELGPDDHREELAQQMKGQVLNLSLQMYSCRVVQRALEVCSLERRIALVRELQDHAMRCVRDQNGNHVIQKCIECVPSEHLTTMLDTFNGQIVSLSMHSFGCRVVQRILEHCGGTPRYDAVMAEVMTAIVQLAQDQYGNYVIQHILEFGRPNERDAVIDTLAPHIVTLSQNKFASNVVEKCLLHGRVDQREALVEAILAGGVVAGMSDGGVCDSPLHQMMRDQFGNYVVQKLLEVCNEDQRERLLEQLRVQLPYLKRLTYGKHIVARVEKLLCSGARISTGALAAAAAAGVAPSSAAGPAQHIATASAAADELAAGLSALDVGLNTEALVAAAAAANAADERRQ